MGEYLILDLLEPSLCCCVSPNLQTFPNIFNEHRKRGDYEMFATLFFFIKATRFCSYILMCHNFINLIEKHLFFIRAPQCYRRADKVDWMCDCRLVAATSSFVWRLSP
jgi:hypothetical protein